MNQHPISKKPLFNLSRVLHETGIKGDTLRAWERRYQLPAPSRTEGGHRLFSAYDIETIKWLTARQEEGMRISQAVRYWRELIAAGTDPLAVHIGQPVTTPAASQPNSTRSSLESLRRSWIEHSLSFAEKEAREILDQAFSQFPWESVSTDLIAAALQEIGARWYSGEISVQQEHFASEIAVNKLQTLIAGAPPPYHPQIVLIATPEGEYHAIAPLIISLLLRYRGWQVTYLGASVPNDRLSETLEAIQPSLVIMAAVRLTSGAALLSTSQFLKERVIPLGFGGAVFDTSPELVRTIPGSYLGNDIVLAVNRIERLLSGQEESIYPDPSSNPLQQLADVFSQSLPELTMRTLRSLDQEPLPDFSRSVIHDANQFFYQDLSAALALGDLDLLHPNLDWIAGMLEYRNFHHQDFVRYLSNVQRVIEEGMNDRGQPISDWLAKYIEGLN